MVGSCVCYIFILFLLSFTTTENFAWANVGFFFFNLFYCVVGFTIFVLEAEIFVSFVFYNCASLVAIIVPNSKIAR